MQPPRLLVHAPAAPPQVRINPQSSTLIESGVPGEPVSAHVDITYVRIVDGVTKLSRMEMAARVQQRQQLLPEVGGGVRNGGRSVGRGGGRSGGGRGGRGARRAESQAADDSTQEMDEAMQARAQSDSENLRKLVLALSTDVRVLLVKLIDRLHNMRTLHFISNPASRRRKAHETLNIYAPLADRLGMARLCHELETLSFRELRPTEHAEIVAEQQRCYHSHELQGMVEGLSELLDLQDHTGGESTRRRSRGSRSSSSVVIRDCAVGSSDGTECWVGDSYFNEDADAAAATAQDASSAKDREVAGAGVFDGHDSSSSSSRGRGSGTGSSWGAVANELLVEDISSYRIWRASVDSGRRLADMQVKDFFTVVLISPSVPACYQVLGAVHSAYPCTGELRDYISTPKYVAPAQPAASAPARV